jgi:multidrug efflux pump
LAAVLLKPHGAKPDFLTRVMDRVLGGFFKRFNRGFTRASNAYSRTVVQTVRRSGIALVVYGGLIALTYFGFNAVPSGFVPDEDKQYVVAIAQLPPAATVERSEEVNREMGEIGLKTPGVSGAVQFTGMSVNGLVPSSSSSLCFFALDDFEKRKTKNLSAKAIAATLNQKLAAIKDAFIIVVPAPAIQGMGTVGGFKLSVEDRGDLGSDALYAAVQEALKKAYQNPAIAGEFSTYQINVPQLNVNVDREKVKRQNVKLSDVFQTLQVYLGSLYINDFNKFGRTYQVVAQADAPYRSHVEDILPLQTRNGAGQMVPLGSLLTVDQTFGPDIVQRYNAYRSADINAGAAPGYSSGQAQAAMVKILQETLPRGMNFEWTDLAYQQIVSGSTSQFVFPLCVLFVFLVLAAQYESLTLPLAIILIVPMCLLAAIVGVLLDHGDNNIFTQVGLIVLVGLACKNAILIVEFAKHLQEEQGHDAVSAVLEAARMRLRPILMTSFAFIMGVVPLMVAGGAGAEIRHALGTTVFAGMLGVLFFGLLLTPVFYVLVRRLTNKADAQASKESTPTTAIAAPEAHHA